MKRQSDGLTLIELLAAVMILSTVAATGVRLTSESRTAVKSVNLRLDAIAVLERWRAENNDLADSDEWSWTDATGRHWRIRVSDGAAAPPTDMELSIPFRWRTIEVIAEDGEISLTILTLRTVASASNELSPQIANASREQP